jgi:hypothetical protein
MPSDTTTRWGFKHSPAASPLSRETAGNYAGKEATATLEIVRNG